MKKVVIACAAAVLALAGCTSAGDTAANEYQDSYRSVEDLRDAFVAAGGDCPEWEQTNQIKAAAESGTCSSSNVLSIYSSDATRDGAVEILKAISDNINLLVGENWVINDDSVQDLDPALGGTLVSK